MVFNLRTFSFTESVEDDPTPPKSFSLKELRIATHNFSRDNLLHEGIIGKVYRGRLADGLLVAVKRAISVNQWMEELFKAQVQVGRTVSMHRNVLYLRGFCRTKKELLLVYPLMINNSLSYHLERRPDRSTQPLDWTTRKRIALGVARGLAHLHDQGGFWRALIVPYGNAKKETIQWPRVEHPMRVSSSSQGEDSDDFDSYSQTYDLYEEIYVDTTYVCGRLGFIAPEYLHTRKCTLKNDVFAYGKMLLELISGQSILKLDVLAYNENLSLEEWIGGFMNKNELERVIDPNLQGNYAEEEAEQLVRLALLCADGNPSVRPKMSKVVTMIKSQMNRQDPSSRINWSGTEYDSTPYYSFPPSPSLSLETC
ncbi:BRASSINOSTEROID INSENSITIVE 1-associated receptor kinase 1-like [Syzygium oleosum]|uniref:BRASSINOSTEROID INSENSITIVE 1-associated receptor kinase 1-like n=1 Tax=Syzygium oleosum TaxID=219896 RepID=UPI0024BA712F|nr:BRASSINOSTEROID INSENSITIVE 1-associated receptor kinase 1-like [Syzygium oleosum]